ncbi:MAG: type II toxin-antitoxin system RelE/ParE family toxin [bacterium]
MIRSFGDERTRRVFNRESVRGLPPEILRRALRKLLLLDAADEITDLRVPPGNRLEKLRGDLEGFWSIRISDQGRIVFRWGEGGTHSVEITDYHR